MCDLVTDLASEEGTVAYGAPGNGPYPVTCASGRVIVAATVWQDWPSSHTASVVIVGNGSGDLIDTVQIWNAGPAPAPLTAPTFYYQLTTAKITSL